ncbi:GWT1-domain-containing protein [Pseudohyphozyma bogoriensis]|nr:GWT1-domain-containing protein [Pseudohyphozyma bogoriensis]
MGDYKAEKEAFVSGSNGGSTTYALWTVLTPHFAASRTSWKTPAWEFMILVLPLLLSLTILSSYPLLLNILLVALILISKRSSLSSSPPPLGSPVTSYSPYNTPTKEKEDWIGREIKGNRGGGGGAPKRKLFVKPWITVYRAHMMLMTVVCILAVDFNVFPREFGKAETWGTSVMDLGVGSFVFSLGMVSALPRLRSKSRTPLFVAMFTSIKHSAGVLALGVVRVLMVKGVDYPEHVSEYGVHWNFFFTLALVPIFGTLLAPLSPTIDYAWIAVIVMGPQRTTFLTANREGIVSLPGYLAIFLLGLSTGLYALPPHPYFYERLHFKPKNESQRKERDRKMEKAWKEKPEKLVAVLASYTIVWWGLYFLLGYLGWHVSRRLANAMYVVWIAAFNTSFLLGYLTVDLYNTTYTTLQTPLAEHLRCPAIFSAVNKNGMVVFLVANLLTGLVNVSIKSMYASDVTAFSVLLVYWFNEQGQGVVAYDDKVSMVQMPGSTSSAGQVWMTESLVADLQTNADGGKLPSPGLINPDGSRFLFTDTAPRSSFPMHHTTSIDYACVIAGEAVLELDDGSFTTLRPGDTVVQQGTLHAWHNKSDEWLRLLFVVLPAKPIEINGKPLEGLHLP